ncbi:MAG: RNA polymerase-binding transcription factor DksA [Myxococcota bacterium]|jgi:RNA polymerase-binding transcription factor DksA
MKYDKIRTSLVAKHAQLTARIGKIGAHLRSPGDPDSQEQAQGMENDEVLEALDDSGREELKLIGGALARIDADTYGDCVKCGESIAPRRLEVLPTTPLCIACAA